jgi:hypothetical protein
MSPRVRRDAGEKGWGVTRTRDDVETDLRSAHRRECEICHRISEIEYTINSVSRLHVDLQNEKNRLRELSETVINPLFAELDEIRANECQENERQ